MGERKCSPEVLYREVEVSEMGAMAWPSGFDSIATPQDSRTQEIGKNATRRCVDFWGTQVAFAGNFFNHLARY
jgi:hypothetical protein